MKQVKDFDTARFNNPIDETLIYNPLALVTKAKGSNVWLKGKEKPYLDLIMSYSSTNFGHVNGSILEFVKKAAEKYDNVIAFNSSSKVDLSKKLIDLLPYPKDKICYFPVGGAKAVDAAIKLAKAFTKKDIIIAFEGGFHGYSYASMSVTDDGYINKSQFGTYPGKVIKFSFPHRISSNTNIKATNILKQIQRYLKTNHSKVAAILFEPIQGAAGFIIPPENFLTELVQLAKEYHIITICDEIQTAVCRTGTFYYINQLDLDPDIILIGKSLAGGYYPLSAVIAQRKLYEAVDLKNPGYDSTFATNLFGIEIANNLLDYIKTEKIEKLINDSGQVLFLELQDLFSRFDFIKDLDYIGMAYGYKVAKFADMAENAKLASIIRQEAFKNYLIIQTAGVNKDHMKISPNFFITKSEIRMIKDGLYKTLKTVSSFF